MLGAAGDRPLDRQAYAALAGRRAEGEPLAYLTGRTEFWSLPFTVDRSVLIPRPDSESLIALALAEAAAPPAAILDLGTGSGCLLLAALSEYPDALGLGVDCSEQALAAARLNASGLGLGDRASFRLGCWGEGLNASFDLILSNPPYVPDGAETGPGVRAYEPHGALFAGPDGLNAYRAIMPQLPRLLGDGGRAILEIGAGQGEDVRRIAGAEGLHCIGAGHDLGGRERALCFAGPAF